MINYSEGKVEYGLSFYKRHTCIICKRKRYEFYMENVFNMSWACKDEYHFQHCCDNEEIIISKIFISNMKKFKYLNMTHIKNN